MSKLAERLVLYTTPELRQLTELAAATNSSPVASYLRGAPAG
jgi:hypothetical protein